MDRRGIKYFIGCGVPIYSCNFRCQYCYLGQHPNNNSGLMPFSEKPEYISEFFSVERLGGYAYFNFCASGETMMHDQLISLVSLLTTQGHYCDIITNGTISKRFDELIDVLDEEQRKHIMIKFSYHWLELKKRNLLELFINNLYKIRDAGISYTLEITPHDELIPYIEEIKTFSLENFGALPHITVARNEATKDIELLTKKSREEYKSIWSVFDSTMFDFKFSIFNKKRCEFCYAGLWSLQLNLGTGDYFQCYGGDYLGNIKNKKLCLRAIGQCREPHCFNGHAYLTYGVIPEIESPTYNEMRDRITKEGAHWIQTDARAFFSTKLSDEHELLSKEEKKKILKASKMKSLFSSFKITSQKVKRKIKNTVK